MTNERSCPCRPGVVTVTNTGIAPFPRKFKSARLLLSLCAGGRCNVLCKRYLRHLRKVTATGILRVTQVQS